MAEVHPGHGHCCQGTPMTLMQQLLCSMVLTASAAGGTLAYWWIHKGKDSVEMDPLGVVGAFLPILDSYLKLADALWALAVVTLGYIASPVIFHEVVPYDRDHLGSLTLVNAWTPFI